MNDALITVLVADNHTMFRAGLRKLLEAAGGFHVVGEADNGVSAVSMARRLAPDILLLDLAMPDMNGIEVLRTLSTSGIAVRVIVLTASISPSQVADALRIGAMGVLMKTAATELLYKCLRAVAAGQYWVGRDMVGSLMEALSTARKAWKEDAVRTG